MVVVIVRTEVYLFVQGLTMTEPDDATWNMQIRAQERWSTGLKEIGNGKILLTKHSRANRSISRWRRSRGYKASAVCEMVAAREAAGV